MFHCIENKRASKNNNININEKQKKYKHTFLMNKGN